MNANKRRSDRTEPRPSGSGALSIRVHPRSSAVSAWLRLCCAALFAVILAGCGLGSKLISMPWGEAPGGSLRLKSHGDEPVMLSGRFDTAVYADRPVETSFFLADRPIEEFLSGDAADGQIVHVELLWIPRAGSTPIEDSATNASIRYIIFADGEMGIYAGAGFAMPRGRAGDETFGLTLRDASLKLVESTPGFNDLLTPARLSGSFGARLDNHQTAQLQHAVSQRVTNKLGRSRIVDAQADARPGV
jgi:hypothetical protein